MIAKVHAAGLRLALWHAPYLEKAVPISAWPNKRLLSPSSGVLLNGWSEPIDFTNPAAKQFWQQRVGRWHRTRD